MKKRFLSIVLTFCMLLSFMPLIPVTAAEGDVAINETNFPDANFRNCVKKFDTIQDGVLTPAEISIVKYINVADENITDLTGVELFTNLATLYCDRNQLESLDLSKNTALTALYCTYNQLESLDLSGNTALEILDCSYNKLTSLDLSGNTALTILYCTNNQLTSLDLSGNTALKKLWCYINQLESLDLSGNTALEELDCSSNELTSLDLSLNTALTTLYCTSNRYKIDLVGDIFDLSKLPTGFDIKNASNWQNATVNDNTLTVSDPKKTVTYTYNLGNNKTTTFRLFWDFCTITANMIDPIADQRYTNADIEPEITITCGSYTLISGTDYTVSYTDNINVGTATATVTGKGNFYKGTVSVYFKIVKADPNLTAPTAQNVITYGATLSTVGLPDGWTWADKNIVPNVTNSGYVAYFTPADTDNYDWTVVDGWNASENRVERTVAVTVNKASQSAPNGITNTAETIDGKADGKITGVTSAMEYRKDGTTDYTAISGTEITGLADGKYYVRYKADANRNASADTEVTITKGRKLTVTVPTTQVGYTLTVNKTELVWNDSVELTFALANGYSKLNNFAVNVNGNPIALDTNGKCTVPNAQSDITVTVIGVADITAPTGEIKLGTNSWKALLNNITFGLFFKDTEEVTITASDTGGEAVKIEYLLSDKALTEAELATKTFTAYSDKFNINPNNEYVIYAKLTDKTGNVTYINSNGIVLDNIAPVISGIVNGNTYCEAQTVTVSDEYEVTVTVNGTPVTLDANGQFILSPASGTQTVVATDKAGNVSAEMIVTVNDGHETDTPATCIKKAVCKHCGVEYGEVDNSNHDLENIKESAATVTETGNTEYWHCKDCDDNFSDKDGKNAIDLWC